MKDQHSTSEDKNEPVRPRTIPDDFIWDPEYQAWFAPGTPTTPWPEYWAQFLEELENTDFGEDPHPGLITVDELRAAGALYVPPAWRKSLSAGQEDNSTRQRSLFSDLSGDDDAPPEEQESTPLDADDDSFADEDE